MADPININLPVLGIDNRSPETAISEGAVRSAVNVDIAGNKVRRRAGYTLAQSGIFRSLYTPKHGDFLLAVKNNALVRLDAALIAVTIASGVGDVSYAEYADSLYWTDGAQRGILTETGTTESWALPIPPAPVVSASVAGGLDAGEYQVCYVYAASGVESGASPASVVTVSQGGGIQLSSVPQTSGVDQIRIFVSPVNGDVLYQHSQITVGAYANYLLGLKQLGKQLETRFLKPLPAGSIIRVYAGRMWSVTGKTLYYSAAQRPTLCDLRSSFFQFPHDIHALESVEDGLYVVTDKRAYFLPGKNPQEMRQIIADDEGAVTGSGCVLSQDALLGIDLPGTVDNAAFWWGIKGNPVVGLPGGQVVKPTLKRFVSPTFERGSIAEVVDRGVKRMIALLHNPGPASQSAASDSVVAEIRRNGIVIG